MGANYSRVRQQHQDIARISADIQNLAQQIVANAKEVGFDPNQPDTCNRLTFYYKNKLNQFNRSTLVQVAYNIGLTPTAEEVRGVNKQQLCDIILEYYRRKIDLVNYVQNLLDGSCRTAERQIAANMEQMLEGAQGRVQQLAYQRLVSLNGAVQTLFERADSALRFIINEDVAPEVLERYVTQAFAMLEQDNVNCCRRTHALRQFAWMPVTVSNVIKFKNMYSNEIVDRLPRVTTIEREFPVAQIPC